MSDDEKKQMVTVRAPKELLKAVDKICPKGKRNETILDALQQLVEKSGGQVEVVVNYKKLMSEADDCRREMDRLERVMNATKDAVETVALRFAELKAENIPLIIQGLRSYSIKPEDGFNRRNAEDYIEWLEAMMKHEACIKEIDNQEKIKAEKAKADEPSSPSPSTSGKGKKRYISPKDLCNCSHYETKLEHNRRCSFNLDVNHEIGIEVANPYTGAGDPSYEFFLIKKFGEIHSTSAEEKRMVKEFLKEHGSIADKVLFNSYLHYRLFPRAFPECDTYYGGKVVTEDADCEELRSLLLTKEQIEKEIEQRNANRVKPHCDPLSMIRMITNSKYGWMYIDGAQKKILDVYLNEHNLPFPRFNGKHVKLEYAVFNNCGGYDITEEGKRILWQQEHKNDEAVQVEENNLDMESETVSEEGQQEESET